MIQHKPARTKTFYIAQEILTTERTYVKGLKLIDRDFRLAVLSANRAHDKPVLPEETLKLILGNVSSILTLNSGLLAELEGRMKQWDSDPRIGDILLNRAPYLKIYSEFISRFDKALKTLEEATKKNLQFARLLREFEAQPACAQLPLAGYMLETVQRIPRYKLLLTDYVKHLPEDSPDRIQSERALEIISSVATHVNETIRQMDNFRKVMEVRKKLIGDTGDTLITPYRKLIKEGMLVKFSRKEPQPRMFFLFNDILIYASSIPPTNTTFKVIKRIPLEGMRMEMVNDPDMRHGFQIISTCKSFRLEASSNEDLHQWMSAFETAIRENREKTQSRKTFRQLNPDGGEESERIPLGHLAPPWLPDSAVSMCQLCSVQFTVTRRRHHCRACGQIFCSDCSSYLAPLRYKSDKLGRVCQSCYESISGEEGGDERTPKRAVTRSVKSQRINLPSVLREVKARDQNAQISGYLLSHAKSSRRWKKKWFIVYNLVLYEFEKHEDVTAKRSVALPSYQIDTTSCHQEPLVFCLKHPGTGKLYFKTDTEEQRDRWLEVLDKAVRGEIASQQDQQLFQDHIPNRAPPLHQTMTCTQVLDSNSI